MTAPDPERLARLAAVAFGADEEPLEASPTVPGPASGPPPAPDRTIGRYLVLETIGRGGFGVVHRVLDRALGRQVALKLLAGEATPAALERFRREVRIAASLQHEHVIRIHETGVHEGALFYTMDLVEGPTLDGLVAPPRQLALLVAQVARGLHAAHQLGVVHRDVKPENILVAPGDRAVLIDFSLAREVLDEGRLTQSGVVAGTLAYLSPEQARGRRAAIDARTDVYGLGATLYRVLTGRPPHEGATPSEVLASVLGRAPTPPRALRPELPLDLETIVLRALSPDPRDRQPTALALALELEAFASGRSVAPRRPRRARRGALVAGGAVGLALAAALGAWRWRPSAPPAPAPLAVRLAVDAPVAGAVSLADDALEVRGRATLDGAPLAALRVSVDGAPVEVAGGAFRTTVPAREGPVRVAAWCEGRPEVRQEVAVVVSAGPLARWFASVPGEHRPETPFRAGLRCAATPGVYLWDAGRGVTTELVWVSPGPFPMGSRWVANAPECRHELPRGLLIGRTEVTWAAYRAYLVSRGRTSSHDPGPAGDRFPANHLSWSEARDLASWLGGRLPSDAEWERAARGADGRHWPWGGPTRESFLPRCNFNDALCTIPPDEGHTPDPWDEVSDGFAGLAPVGSYPDGASPCGALDVCGNVMEWCEDWFAPEASPRDAEYPPREGALRCTRGGNYRDVWYMTHPAQRQGTHPATTGSEVGLRIVVEATP